MRRLSLALALTSAACGQKLDVYTHVHDLRVLAVRAEPPEVLADDASGATDIRFDALVLDPRGGEITYQWTFCPGESERQCDPQELQQVPRFGSTLESSYSATAPASALPEDAASGLPDVEELRPYAIASFTVQRGNLTSLVPYFLETNALGFGGGAWPTVVLDLQKEGDEPLTTIKREVLGIADLTSAIQLIGTKTLASIEEELGVSICTPNQTPEADGCIAFAVKQPNQNPAFAYDNGFPARIAKSDLATATFSPIDAYPIEIHTGDSIRILPLITPESAEPYQLLRADLETRKVEILDVVEEPSVSWFVTDGKVQDRLTWPKLTRSLDTVYTAPQTPPEATSGMVTVWMVARDGRGGVAWEHVDLRVID